MNKTLVIAGCIVIFCLGVSTAWGISEQAKSTSYKQLKCVCQCNCENTDEDGETTSEGVWIDCDSNTGKDKCPSCNGSECMGEDVLYGELKDCKRRYVPK